MNDLPILHTARTTLCVPSPASAPLLQAYRIANRAHLASWEPARTPADFTLEAARARLERSLAEARAGSALHFLAFARADADDAGDDGGDGAALLATCSFTNIVRGPFQACHLGFSVAAHRQGTGLMHEVAATAIAHMFAHEGLHRIMACHMPANARSAALLGRLGFVREGLARSYLRIAGRWEDMVLTSLVNPRD
ncbi:GNAT family N-acetyltransferase [uncultured Massilia sp.]|uniref:GNAT family N-acetyltransferase n=1 Tax=uncultured Massilia sp. TaxID=169973 RepID=UPI0025D33870|nr:GNAT family N-acetyltransferase [uncultured Massilia sp.]